MSNEWNHNIQYHGLVVSTVPCPCIHGLDVGCGGGVLTRQLATLCVRMTGIDSDAQAVLPVIRAEPWLDNVNVVVGDVMTYPFPDASFTFISAVATLHHLPLELAFARFRALLAPGGVLTIIGLYRADGLDDFLFATAGIPASWIMKRFRNFVEVEAPMLAPKETLSEIRDAANNCLPGNILKRRLLFRYSLVWRKPSDPDSDR